jgi:hypothetical protein
MVAFFEQHTALQFADGNAIIHPARARAVARSSRRLTTDEQSDACSGACVQQCAKRPSWACRSWPAPTFRRSSISPVR